MSTVKVATKEMRVAYAETLIELAKEDPALVVLEADLMKASGTTGFAGAYPGRAFNVGVAEANMVGVASGLSAAGKIPFAATFCCFAARRAFDQFFVSANYARLNVKLVGTDPGVSAAYNGGTHMSFEDLGLMRTIPGLWIFEPSDAASVRGLVRVAAETFGCCYMRLHRRAVSAVYDEGEVFEMGRAKLLRAGRDITIVALGAIMVAESLKAADELAKDGVDAGVIDALSLKPLDESTIRSEAEKTGLVVTCENHQIRGGLGSAVAELLAETGVGRLVRVGVQDEFGEVGTQDYLQKRFGLTSENIARTVRSALSLKTEAHTRGKK